MSRSRDPYGLAIDALLRFADSGRFAPGDPLVVTELAETVGLSATPLREALAHLAGQGVVDRRPGRGYFYPRLTAPEIIDLQELQRAHVHAALTLHSRGVASLQKAAAALSPDAGPGPLCDAIVAQSQNAALAAAYRRVARRLTVVHRLEDRLGLVSRERAGALIRSAVEGRIEGLQEQLRQLHDLRCAQAWRLSRMMAGGDGRTPGRRSDPGGEAHRPVGAQGSWTGPAAGSSASASTAARRAEASRRRW